MTPRLLTVSQINRQIRQWLEQDVGEVHVEGEVSNVSKPTSGHVYFTLKDSSAQLRCAYFRNRHATELDVHHLQNGQQVVARGHLSLYEARGDYQLIVEQVSAAGLGDLHRQFELLKTKLAALGLFDVNRKKSIPRFPQSIGVITSPTGAALRDVLTTLARRYPLAPVILYPSDVQGKLAAGALIQAVKQANLDRRCDVLILVRGGGSIEDLWPFNDEQLAHTLASSSIPVVTGIGHETDFTIVDFVADVRAATPTAAAESVTPDQQELLSLLHIMQTRLVTAISRYLQQQTWRLRHAHQKLTSPQFLITTYWQTMDYLERHVIHAIQQMFIQRRHALHVLTVRLMACHPRALCQAASSRLEQLTLRLAQTITFDMQQKQQRLKGLMQTLNTVSPLATLDRGYAIVTCRDQLVMNSETVNKNDTIDVRLANGRLKAKVI